MKLNLFLNKIKSQKEIYLICLLSIFFIIILVQNHNTRKQLKKLQVFTQESNKNSKAQESNKNSTDPITQNMVSINQQLTTIQNSQKQLQDSIEAVKINSEALLRNAMAEKVESLVKDKTTTEEKVIAIASWVSSNIANNHHFGSGGSIENVYLWFSGRSGLCMVKSTTFVEMLKYINVYSSIHNICKFPTCNESHSAVQVYYDGSWHFFDVAYAGYFKKNNKILSFKEIVEISKKEDPLQYLIVFKETLDYYRSPSVNSLFLLPEDKIAQAVMVDNAKRMRHVYVRYNVKNAAGYGNFKDSSMCNDFCK